MVSEEWKGQKKNINGFGDRMLEITQCKQHKETTVKKRKKTRTLKTRDHNKRSNIHVIEVSEEEKDGGAEKLAKEIMPGDSPNLAKDMNLWI